MTKPVTIPNTFATATTAIPLSQLDSDFSTVATALNDANTYSNYAADTGVANAYVVTLTGVSTTYSAGLRIQFKAGAANTGASTLNVNAGGTKNITFQDASALSSGTIAANAIVDVMYDGTQFLLMNDPAGTVGTGDVVGPAGATDNAIVRFDGATGKLVQNSVVTIADSTGDIAGVGALTATGNVSFDGGTFVFNESGADKDFRIEGDTEPNLFFTDASTDRVGIGTSSVRQRLEVSGSIELANTSVDGVANALIAGLQAQPRPSVSNATYAAANIQFRTDPTYYYKGVITFGVSGDYSSAAPTEAMRLDSSGNLGLGVTPNAGTSGKVFQITNAGHFMASGSTVYIDANAYFDSGWKYITSAAASNYYQSAGSHIWSTAPSGTAGNAITFTQAMTLNASGELLIGGTAQGRETNLSVDGTYQDPTGVWTQVGIYSTDSQAANKGGTIGFGGQDGSITKQQFAAIKGAKENGTSGNYAGYLAFYSRPAGDVTTERVRITSGGDVGIGTNSPSSILDVQKAGTAAATTDLLELTNSGNAASMTNTGTGILFNQFYYDATTPAVADAGRIAVKTEGNWTSTASTQDAYMTFEVAVDGAVTERARITSGGYFKASNNGTYLGSTGNYHELRNTTTAFEILHATQTAANPYGIQIEFTGAAPNGTGNWFLYCNDTGGLRTEIRSNGGIANYSANNVNLSDRREKTNFAPAKSYLDTICAIPVQTFNYIDQSEDDPGLTLGVVAQDVQAVAPELVMESNWGTKDDPKMRLSIYQTDLQYALMKCIQELKADLDATKAELAALKGTQP